MKSTIRFSNRKTKEKYYALAIGTGTQKLLYKEITFALDKLEINAFSGIQIPKRLIPSKYLEYKNLWKYNLPKGWRMLYSVVSDEEIVLSVIIDWFDHKNYERTLGY
jgi:hypothetical protein